MEIIVGVELCFDLVNISLKNFFFLPFMLVTITQLN